MTEKVHLVRSDDLPMPLIYLAGPQDLADWYAQGLLHTLAQGQRALSIGCFDTQAAFGFPNSQAAQAVLRAVTDVLYDHPEAESLTILCGDEESWRAYRFCWNLWYAERKPEHGEDSFD